MCLCVISACSRLTCDNLQKLSYDQPALQSVSRPIQGSWQGIQIINDHIYLYGDGDSGIMEELDVNLLPTGWTATLTRAGSDAITHPTGFAIREGMPTFLSGENQLLHVDWEQLYRDRTLDHAILNTIETGGRGVRPEYVLYDGNWYVASAEYDPRGRDNELLLMDPGKLAAAAEIDAPGVIVHRIAVSRYIQDIVWDDAMQRVLLVQNIARSSGWRLTTIDLDTAVRTGATSDDALDSTRCILNGSELEGYGRSETGDELFLTGDRADNLFMTLSATDEIGQ